MPSKLSSHIYLELLTMEFALEERVSVINPFLLNLLMLISPLISSNGSQQAEWYFYFLVVLSLGAANGNDPRPYRQPALTSTQR
jgi:hypothetical protein